MEAQTALEMLKSNTLSVHQCFRALVSFDNWIVAAKEQDGQIFPALNQGPDGHWLLVFSSSTAFKNYLKSQNLPEDFPYMTLQGRWLFSSADEKIQGIALDFQSPHALPIAQDKFLYLNQWSETLAIEDILVGLQSQGKKEHFKAVQQFPRFYLPITKQDGKSQIVLTPDSENRSLAAIFTAQDAGELFIEEAESGLKEEVVLEECTGQNLFSSLQNLMLDGLVFNPAGPIQPQAFGLALLDAIMIATYQKEPSKS
jgi:hypothetical protein